MALGRSLGGRQVEEDQRILQQERKSVRREEHVEMGKEEKEKRKKKIKIF